MDETPTIESADLAHKIARLVEERGWNQEEFARIARLNRHTVRQILLEAGSRKLRNATVSACARALGLSVHELRNLPLDRLLPRMRQSADEMVETDIVRRFFTEATQPELRAWIERNPERARLLSDEEQEELLALQGDGGPLNRVGVDGFVQRIERKRKLLQQIQILAGTEYLDLLERLVQLMIEKVQPPRERS